MRAKLGTLYGIGVGPGDPELITMKGVKILARCRHIFVPKAGTASESIALSIAGQYLHPDAAVRELHFPMSSNKKDLSLKWGEAATAVINSLDDGKESAFLTLGDPLLYSTYIYLLREIRTRVPDARVMTIPGIMAFSAAAALAEFPIGEGKDAVHIIPTAADLEDVQRGLDRGGTVVMMKIGKRLPDILNLLEKTGLMESSVFVSHAGMPGQRVETDLRVLKSEDEKAGYLSIILVHAGGGKKA